MIVLPFCGLLSSLQLSLVVLGSLFMLTVVMGVTETPPPQLNGQHLDITVVVDQYGFVNKKVNEEDGSVFYSGFVIDVLEALARSNRANFTYTLKPPSGYGSLCPYKPPEPYPREFWHQYNCGQSDVTDFPRTNYTTDMYVGTFFITPERQLLNHFTVPLYPPTTGTQTMVGSATNIRDFNDLVEQQETGKQGPACVMSNTAYSMFLQETFPTMKLMEIDAIDVEKLLDDETCEVILAGNAISSSYILGRSQRGRCHTNNGKPIGTIGDPLGFGLNYYAFGIRKDLPIELVTTLNYWLNFMMTCSPNMVCPNDSLAVLYPKNGGTGRECGYVQFPPSDDGMDPKFVAGIVFAAVTIVMTASFIFYRLKLQRQQRRYKKRFVQQIARNINIGPSPTCIPADKLAEQVQHIGNSEGTITKDELLKWMFDVKLEFISDRDFDALWSAMDLDNKGSVNAIDFFVFLSACGSEFEEVYQEQLVMPKTERLRLAARRLSNINKLGEDGVRAVEQRMDRNRSTGGVSLGNMLNA